VLSALAAEQAGLADSAHEIGLGALIHDVGTIGMPAAVLEKPGRLTPDEWLSVRRHPLRGLELLASSPAFRGNVSEVVSQHHERTDGSGYPGGLRGDAICAAARLVALADVYDAMTSDRPYRAAAPPARAIRWILGRAGRQFDPEIDRAFARAVGLYPVGSLVRLNTGELAIVAAGNSDSVHRPSLLIITSPWGLALRTPQALDLAAPFPGASRREIVGLEEIAQAGPIVELCLSVPAGTAARELPTVDLQA
jgi:HD-GYP domain-containing protein (c-di-GMP phosphodiesterase class II)